MKKTLFIIALSFVANSFAQSTFETVLTGSQKDATQYFQSYFEPAFKGLTYNMGQGWYTSARTHKKLGFDLTISVAASRPPVAAESFTFNPADYNYMTVKTGSNVLPTVVGDNTTTIMQVDLPYDSDNDGVDDDVLHQEFDAPSGVKQDLIDAGAPFTAIPSPMAQIGFGLGHTDLSLRYMPNVGQDGVEIKLFGLAIKHDVLQHFKKEDSDKKGLLSLSVLAGYTKLTGAFTPQTPSFSGANQNTALTITNFDIEAIAGVNFKIIEFYGAIGYNTGKTNFAINGSYDISYTDSSNNTITKTITDPLNLDFNVSSMKTTIGTRLNLAFFKIFASYSLQKYNSFNAGIAISIR